MEDKILEKNNESRAVHRTVIIEWITILAAVLGCFGILYGRINSLESQISLQGARTDKLYELFVTVQNEIKDLHGRVCIIETKNQEKKG